MPAIIKAKVIEGKDLPIMDRASDLTDAFVELRLGSITFKTDVYRKSLNPQWDSDWFKFEIDDEDLQEEYLQFKVLDHDVYSAHDMIGKVNINLDVLCTSSTNEISGAFPIYDTLHGVRGYLRIKIRIQFFTDANKFRQTSCGVSFFSARSIPAGYYPTQIFGLVNELLVNDDPEYQWIDKIRTPRASNEARQRLFIKLSGQIRRKIGLKVLEMGGNAVVGYLQNFDLEGDTGLVVRAIGTVVYLSKDADSSQVAHRHAEEQDHLVVNRSDSVFSANVSIPQRYHGHIVRTRSICQDTEEKSQDGSYENKHTIHLFKSHLEEQDFLFFTFTCPPNGFISHIGGIVASRSVKLLDKINNPDEPETREGWWNELRKEIKSHAKAIGCHAVVGYSEYSSICDDLIVMSACGTAACIKTLSQNNSHTEAHLDLADKKDSFENHDVILEDEITHATTHKTMSVKRQSEFDSISTSSNYSDTPQNDSLHADSHLPSCMMCHIPYSENDLPLPIKLFKCQFCRQDKVPDVLFATIDLPEEMPITGQGCMIQARVMRTKKREKDEANAENISQILPFIEFDLHSQIMNKLKIKGMNAIFGVRTKLCIGEQAIVGIMSGTAVFLSALPAPSLLVLTGRKDSLTSSETQERSFSDIQKKLIDLTKSNQLFYNLKSTGQEKAFSVKEMFNGANSQATDENKFSEKLDLLTDVKETYILEVDDANDSHVIELLNDYKLRGFNIFNTQASPGFPLLHQEFQYITIFHRAHIPSYTLEDDSKLCHWLASTCDHILTSVRLKVRHLLPCCLMKTSFDVELTDDEYLQICMNTFAARVDERFDKPRKKTSRCSMTHSESSQSEISSKAVEDISMDSAESAVSNVDQRQQRVGSGRFKGGGRVKSNSHPFFQPSVIICPLDALPNSLVTKYVGNINLFLIRESTDVKEDGGLNVFMQKFMNEIHAVVRAHVQALGGNAILSFRVEEIVLLFNPHKNQAQCLLNVSGDAADVKFSCPESTLIPTLDHQTSNGSINTSPVSTQPPELIEEIKYKLSRAVYGTSV